MVMKKKRFWEPFPKILTLDMVTAVFAETSENLKHSKLRIPESRSYAVKSSLEKLRTNLNKRINDSVEKSP
jgi:hypothetical protein